MSCACSQGVTNGFITTPVSIVSHSGIFKLSKQKEITGAEIGTAGKVGHNIPLGSRNQASWFGLAVWGTVVSVHLDSATPGWQAIYNRCRGQASLHFLVHSDIDFFYAEIQVLVPLWEKYLNVSGDYVEVWRLPAATMCHVQIEVRIELTKFSASGYLLPYFFKTTVKHERWIFSLRLKKMYYSLLINQRCYLTFLRSLNRHHEFKSYSSHSSCSCFSVLGLFAKLQKWTISFVIFVCLSVRM